MAILANRVRTKNHLLEIIKFTAWSLRKYFIIALIAACSYLLYFPIQNISKLSLEVSGMVLSAGSMVSDTMIENIKLLCDRLSYFKNLEAENIKLKLQLARLSALETQATNALSENQELRKLLNVTENLERGYITSRLVGANITPLSSSALIEAGSNNNVKIDDLVTNQDGLIGKVTNVSNSYASVMLLNDPNSRVPVITSVSKERGILTKQGDHMLLIYLPEDHNVMVDELIYTSGDGKVYPYGLLVGRIYKVGDDGVFVKLSTNLNNIEFVTIGSNSQEN